MRWGALFSLDLFIEGRGIILVRLFVALFDMASGRAVEGAKRYPMTTFTSVRRGTGTIGISEAANYRESSFLISGRHDGSTIQLEVSFFLATRASRIAGR